MVNAAKVFFLVLSALFPIVDPLGGSPIFLLLTKGHSSATRRALSWRIALNSFLLMVGCYFIGSHVLDFFGVSLPVVQVAGGLVVVSVAWRMLAEKEEVRGLARKDIQSDEVFRRAFYPLTLPLTVGPGSISVAITLGANSARHYGMHVLVGLGALAAIAVVAVTVFLSYAFAARLARVLGEVGTTVLLRLSSFLLLCIGVQIVWNGLSVLLSSIQPHLQ